MQKTIDFVDVAAMVRVAYLRLSTSPNLLILSYLSQIFFYGLNYSILYGEVRYGYNFSVKAAKVKKVKV